MIELERYRAKNNFWLRVFFFFLPRWMLRFTFLASLAAATGRISANDAQAVHALNEILHLANNDEALQLATSVTGLIWEHKEAPEDQEIQYLDLHTKAENFVNAIPDWLRYDRREIMVEEVARALSPTLPTLAA